MHGGMIVDATLIAAPSSTKNETGERDPEMHQTKKENQWYFGTSPTPTLSPTPETIPTSQKQGGSRRAALLILALYLINSASALSSAAAIT